jgi:hypothetical protein
MAIGYGVRFPAGASDISPFHSVQTDFVTQPAAIPGGKTAGGLQPTANLHLVPRSKIMELYLHSPVCLHRLVLY